MMEPLNRHAYIPSHVRPLPANGGIPIRYMYLICVLPMAIFVGYGFLFLVEKRARDAPETRLILFLRLQQVVLQLPTPAGFSGAVLSCTVYL